MSAFGNWYLMTAKPDGNLQRRLPEPPLEPPFNPRQQCIDALSDNIKALQQEEQKTFDAYDLLRQEREERQLELHNYMER